MYCLNFSVYATKWWCSSGIKAPAWLADVLEETQGRIPALKNGAKYHFFISKKDGVGPGSGKNLAYAIGRALRDVGYKVWLSQFEKQNGNSVNVNAMQLGIKQSEMILVILSEGIFHQDRIHVTHTELKYAIETCEKPVALFLEPTFQIDNKLPCGHRQECCQDVRPDFQSFARAMLNSLSCETWSYGRFSQRSKISWLTNEFVHRQKRFITLKKQIATENQKKIPMTGCAGRSMSAGSFFPSQVHVDTSSDGQQPYSYSHKQEKKEEEEIEEKIKQRFWAVHMEMREHAEMHNGEDLSSWGTKDQAGTNTPCQRRRQARQIMEFDKVLALTNCRSACCLFQGSRILAVNKIWEIMTGHVRNDVVGKTMNILQGPRTFDGDTLAKFANALYSGQDASAKLWNYTKDGTLFQNDARVHCLPDRMFLGFSDYDVQEGEEVERNVEKVELNELETTAESEQNRYVSEAEYVCVDCNAEAE
jgi:hypothetical protein